MSVIQREEQPPAVEKRDQETDITNEENIKESEEERKASKHQVPTIRIFEDEKFLPSCILYLVVGFLLTQVAYRW